MHLSQHGNKTIAAQLSEKNKKEEEQWLQAQDSCSQAQWITDDGEPGKEEGVSAIPLVQFHGPGRLPLVHPQQFFYDKIRAPYSDSVGDKGAQHITQSGDSDQLRCWQFLENQGDQQPFRPQGQESGSQKAEKKEGRKAMVEEEVLHFFIIN